MMITACRSFAALPIALALLISACDSGSPSRTPDEFAADSALAADLALANRDTLLVDSIGAYRPPAAMDSSTAVFDDVESPAPSPAPSAVPVQPDVAEASPPSAPGEATPSESKSAAPPAPRLSGTRTCSSPTLENQNECLRALLPAADARLNRIYRALITEMRRQEGVRGGARDPASVQRLRVAQRAWLVYRDNECRKRGRGREGTRWARPRVRCLGQFANRRANELADDFSKLTAR